MPQQHKLSFLKAIPAHMRRVFCEIIESGTARLVTDAKTQRELLLFDDDDKAFEPTAQGIRAVPIPDSYE
jgi:hypothetical protein